MCSSDLNFVNEDLSNWYIRRNRRRFWGSAMDDDKRAVYRTTWEVLEGLCRLCAPYTPYITEEIYRDLTGAESVHLADYPVADEALISDAIEGPMDLVRDLVSLGRSAREDAAARPASAAVQDRNGWESAAPVAQSPLDIRSACNRTMAMASLGTRHRVWRPCLARNERAASPPVRHLGNRRQFGVHVVNCS